MRIRSTKPEFWRSKTIAQLAWDVRLVLKGLESYVDDNGVGKDDLALIAADVFPRDLSRDPRDTLARLSEAISTISDASIIARYTFDGEDLLYIEKWKDIQRIDKPGKGRFPRPDGSLEYIQPVSRESYGNPRESVANPPEVLAPVTGEQGSSGTEDQGIRSEAPQAAPKPPRGCRLSRDWMPSEALIAEMKAECPNVDFRTEHRKFIDHWTDKTGKDATKISWDGTWRNWIRRARPSTPTGGSTVDDKVNGWLEMAQPQPHLKAIGE